MYVGRCTQKLDITCSFYPLLLAGVGPTGLGCYLIWDFRRIQGHSSYDEIMSVYRNNVCMYRPQTGYEVLAMATQHPLAAAAHRCLCVLRPPA